MHEVVTDTCVDRSRRHHASPSGVAATRKMERKNSSIFSSVCQIPIRCPTDLIVGFCIMIIQHAGSVSRLGSHRLYFSTSSSTKFAPFSSVIAAEPSSKNYSEADPRCGSHLLPSAAIGCNPDIRRKLKLGMIKFLSSPWPSRNMPLLVSRNASSLQIPRKGFYGKGRVGTKNQWVFNT
jgi:hypothetical protein